MADEVAALQAGVAAAFLGLGGDREKMLWWARLASGQLARIQRGDGQRPEKRRPSKRTMARVAKNCERLARDLGTLDFADIARSVWAASADARSRYPSAALRPPNEIAAEWMRDRAWLLWFAEYGPRVAVQSVGNKPPPDDHALELAVRFCAMGYEHATDRRASARDEAGVPAGPFVRFLGAVLATAGVGLPSKSQIARYLSAYRDAMNAKSEAS